MREIYKNESALADEESGFDLPGSKRTSTPEL
jgi:hypothetical protein